MSEITAATLKKEFKKHKFFLVREFVLTLLPLPLAHYCFFTIKTAEGISMQVWGTSAAEVMQQLKQFAKLEFYL